MGWLQICLSMNILCAYSGVVRRCTQLKDLWTQFWKTIEDKDQWNQAVFPCHLSLLSKTIDPDGNSVTIKQKAVLSLFSIVRNVMKRCTRMIRSSLLAIKKIISMINTLSESKYLKWWQKRNSINIFQRCICTRIWTCALDTHLSLGVGPFSQYFRNHGGNSFQINRHFNIF